MTKRLIPLALLLIYSALLLKVMVFKDIPLIRLGMLKLNFGGTLEGPANFVPLKTIIQYLHADKGVLIAAINILGNIFLLVPFGFLVTASFSNITWLKKITLAFAVGFLIEGMQAVLHKGIFDIDDVILNGMGVIVGYWKYGFFQQLFPSTRSKIIFFVTILFIVIALFGISYYRNGQFPIGFENAVIHKTNGHHESRDLHQGADPCNGTGGTGQIISVGVTSIDIKRKDEVVQQILISLETKISGSTGSLTKNDLKTGDRVTVVTTDEKMTASVILVCN
jgi:glycopeptide antibiotics resistance protein